ncbi:MAG: hypothetical protein GY839_02855 [candidate division Zixibacteria bacterium]|nr:hypothetical protein [candidate division Zixibacteria bacterium]
MNHRNMFSKQWRFRNNIQLIGLAVIVSIGIAGYLLKSVPLLIDSGHSQYFPTLHLSVLLLGSVMVLAWQWLNAVKKEVLIYKNHFNDFIPRIPQILITVVVILMALSLGILSYFATNLLLFALYFMCYKFIEMYGFTIMKEKLQSYQTVVENNFSPGDGRWQYWKIIADYYFDQPHVSRSLGMILFAFISCFIYALAGIFDNYSVKVILQISSYLIMTLNILISELVLNHWQRQRDEALNEYGEYYL